MFLGDYWSIGGRIWRIVDMDYWYNCGDTAFTSHHLVIMPDEALYNAQMNTTNVTTGGYVGSAMYKSNLANAKTIVNAAFQGSVLTHREYLCNAVANGRPSGGAWFDSSIELPNKPMMVILISVQLLMVQQFRVSTQSARLSWRCSWYVRDSS